MRPIVSVRPHSIGPYASGREPTLVSGDDKNVPLLVAPTLSESGFWRLASVLPVQGLDLGGEVLDHRAPMNLA